MITRFAAYLPFYPALTLALAGSIALVIIRIVEVL